MQNVAGQLQPVVPVCGIPQEKTGSFNGASKPCGLRSATPQVSSGNYNGNNAASSGSLAGPMYYPPQNAGNTPNHVSVPSSRTGDLYYPQNAGNTPNHVSAPSSRTGDLYYSPQNAGNTPSRGFGSQNGSSPRYYGSQNGGYSPRNSPQIVSQNTPPQDRTLGNWFFSF